MDNGRDGVGPANRATATGGGGLPVGAAPDGRVAAPPAWMGKRVGRFKLVGLIGQGSMGRVFRAEDVPLQRYAALKVLPAVVRRGAEAVAVERLLREARAAATLEHPNVVTIYEVGESGGVHYIAMELIDGGNLRDLVKAAGPLDPPRACLLCADAAEALDQAHQRGIVHRDVKPSNLMLTRSGRCKVADFGLARVDGTGELSGRIPESVGTPLYAAPEVYKGSQATAQSDIYSLGATLWHLLTGRPPFHGATAVEIARRHVSDPLPDLAALRPELPPALVQAVRRALAKDPHQRFESADQFARVLRLHTIPVESSTAALPPLAAVSTEKVRSAAGGTAGGRPAAAAPGHRRGRRQLYAAAAAGVVLATIVGTALTSALSCRGGQEPSASPSALVSGQGRPAQVAPAPERGDGQVATTPAAAPPPATTSPAPALAPGTVPAGTSKPAAVTPASVTPASAAPVASRPAASAPTARAAARPASRAVRPGPVIVNLLDKLDVARAAVKGTWKLEGGDLTSDTSGPAILEFPQAVPAEYDFRIEFTPEDCVEQLLFKPAAKPGGAGTAFNWCMNVGEVSGLESLNGAHVYDTTSPVTRRWRADPGRRHVSLVRVRNDGVQALLDGQMVVEWKTDYGDLSRFDEWAMRNNDRLGVGTWNKPTRFHKVELIVPSPR